MWTNCWLLIIHSFAYFSAPIAKAVHGLLVIQALRPDRLIAMARIFVEKTLGAEFVHITEKELDLSQIVETEVGLAAPWLPLLPHCISSSSLLGRGDHTTYLAQVHDTDLLGFTDNILVLCHVRVCSAICGIQIDSLLTLRQCRLGLGLAQIFDFCRMHHTDLPTIMALLYLFQNMGIAFWKCGLLLKVLDLWCLRKFQNTAAVNFAKD